MNAYLAVVAVAGMWLLLWVIFCGLGLVVWRVFGRRVREAGDLLYVPWLGWGGAIAFLQFWHLHHAIDHTALLTVGALGLFGLALHGRDLATLLAQARRSLTLGAVGLGLAALWLANQSVMQPGIYDSGLYHLNGVRWAAEFPIVPGLGNLHAGLGFNNTSLLYAAMLDVGPFQHRSHQLASGFLMLLLLMQCLQGLCIVYRERTKAQTVAWFYALFTPPFVAWIITSGYPSSPSPDVPCFLFEVLLGGELLRMLESTRGGRREGFEPFGSLCFLAMIGITVKISFVIYGAAAGGLAFLIYGLRARQLRHWVAAGFLVAALAMLVLVPWCLRGVIMSGYPAYPVPLGRCPVDWAVSPSSAPTMTTIVRAWSRIPGVPPETVLHTWSWLGPWFRRTLHENTLDFVAPLVTAAAGAVILLVRALRGARPRCNGAWAALLPAAAGVLFWFFSAPDPRFQGAMLWVLGLVVFCLALQGAGPYAPAMGALQALLVLAIFVNPLNLVWTWKDPGPARRVPMKILTTRSGLQMHVPVTGDQAWDSDLPATPYFSPRLRLRVAGDMRHGFTRQAGMDSSGPVGGWSDILLNHINATAEKE